MRQICKKKRRSRSKLPLRPDPKVASVTPTWRLPSAAAPRKWPRDVPDALAAEPSPLVRRHHRRFDQGRPCDRLARRVADFEIDRHQSAITTIAETEMNRLVRHQSVETNLFDLADVDKGVSLSLDGDEAVAFGGVEPLHGSENPRVGVGHGKPPFVAG